MPGWAPSTPTSKSSPKSPRHSRCRSNSRHRRWAATLYVGIVDLDADLIAYYEAEARSGRRSKVGEFRRGLWERFHEVVVAEGRRHLIDVGAGPGLNTAAWQAEGLDVVGVDLTEANVRLMGERGLVGITGSLYRLPFRDHAFDSLWTMSTFVHVPHTRFDEATTEMLRAVA